MNWHPYRAAAFSAVALFGLQACGGGNVEVGSPQPLRQAASAQPQPDLTPEQQALVALNARYAPPASSAAVRDAALDPMATELASN